MYNPHSMYLLGKSIQADRLKEAEQWRLVKMARAQKAEKPESDRRASLRLSIAARSAIVIALAVALNIAG